MLQQEHTDGQTYSIPKITKQHLKGVKNGFYEIYNTETGDIHTKDGIVNYGRGNNM